MISEFPPPSSISHELGLRRRRRRRKKRRKRGKYTVNSLSPVIIVTGGEEGVYQLTYTSQLQSTIHQPTSTVQQTLSTSQLPSSILFQGKKRSGKRMNWKMSKVKEKGEEEVVAGIVELYRQPRSLPNWVEEKRMKSRSSKHDTPSQHSLTIYNMLL